MQKIRSNIANKNGKLTKETFSLRVTQFEHKMSKLTLKLVPERVIKPCRINRVISRRIEFSFPSLHSSFIWR